MKILGIVAYLITVLLSFISVLCPMSRRTSLLGSSKLHEVARFCVVVSLDAALYSTLRAYIKASLYVLVLVLTRNVKFKKGG